MTEMHRKYYEKRGAILVKNLKSRHFDAYYCATKEAALKKALELIPQGATVGWGGVMSAHEIGLVEALNAGNYNAIDRDKFATPEEKLQAAKDAMFADVFLTGANALSLDGEMVNIDGHGNRVACSLYGHEKVYFVFGVNKIAPTLEKAIWRARNIAAPINAKRLGYKTPCAVKGDRCYDCDSPDRICNAMVLHLHKLSRCEVEVIVIGQEMGF